MISQSWAQALLLAAAVSMPLFAQDISEEEFLQEALEGHPALVAGEAVVQAEIGRKRQAGAFENPEIEWEREDPDRAAKQDTWRLSWRLPIDGRRHRVAEAEAAAAASRSELAGTRLGVRLELRALFANWYLASERDAALKRQVERARRLAAWLLARAEEGEAAGVDAKRVALEVEVLERDALVARAEAQSWRAAAAVWSTGVSEGAKPKRPLLMPLPSDVGIAGRPDLKVLEQQLRGAESRHRLERIFFRPPEISAGWTEISEGDQTFDGPVLGVMWPVPLFDRNRGNREAAAAEEMRASAELEAARRRATQQVRSTSARYAELLAAVQRHSASDLDGDIVEPILAAFEAGEAGLTDVLDALQATVEVELARLETLNQALQAQRELEAALGRSLTDGESS